jgi:hypothetical protein
VGAHQAGACSYQNEFIGNGSVCIEVSAIRMFAVRVALSRRSRVSDRGAGPRTSEGTAAVCQPTDVGSSRFCRFIRHAFLGSFGGRPAAQARTAAGSRSPVRSARHMRHGSCELARQPQRSTCGARDDVTSHVALSPLSRSRLSGFVSLCCVSTFLLSVQGSTIENRPTRQLFNPEATTTHRTRPLGPATTRDREPNLDPRSQPSTPKRGTHILHTSAPDARHLPDITRA